MPIRSRISTFVVSLALLLPMAGPAGARAEWNHAAVTTLAHELKTATRSLTNTLRKDPTLASAVEFGDRNATSFWEAVDGLEKSARQLAHRLENGANYAETAPIATKMRSQVRSARTRGASLMSSAFIDAKTQPVEALLAKLAPYYYD